MKRFAFRLDPVLRLREQEREQRLRLFGEAQRRTGEQQRRLAEYWAEHGRARNDLAARRRGELDLAAARMQEQYVRTMEKRIDDGNARLRDLAKAQEGAREAYVEARKKVRVLERLKERRREKWRGEYEREERKVLDEAGRRTGGVP